MYTSALGTYVHLFNKIDPKIIIEKTDIYFMMYIKITEIVDVSN